MKKNYSSAAKPPNPSYTSMVVKKNRQHLKAPSARQNSLNRIDRSIEYSSIKIKHKNETAVVFQKPKPLPNLEIVKRTYNHSISKMNRQTSVQRRNHRNIPIEDFK